MKHIIVLSIIDVVLVSAVGYLLVNSQNSPTQNMRNNPIAINSPEPSVTITTTTQVAKPDVKTENIAVISDAVNIPEPVKVVEKTLMTITDYNAYYGFDKSPDMMTIVNLLARRYPDKFTADNIESSFKRISDVFGTTFTISERNDIVLRLYQKFTWQ